jgi:hypothetical protein
VKPAVSASKKSCMEKKNRDVFLNSNRRWIGLERLVQFTTLSERLSNQRRPKMGQGALLTVIASAGNLNGGGCFF